MEKLKFIWKEKYKILKNSQEVFIVI